MRKTSGSASSARSDVLAAGGQRVLRGRHRRALADQLHRLRRARCAAEGVGPHAVEDREEPGADVGARLVAVEGAVGAQEGLLDQVLGVVGVPGHPIGGPVEGPQVGKRFGLEPFLACQSALREGPSRGKRRPASSYSRFRPARADSVTARRNFRPRSLTAPRPRVTID